MKIYQLAVFVGWVTVSWILQRYKVWQFVFNFKGRIISHHGEVNGPPISCGLTPIVVFVRIFYFIKSHIYINKRATFEHLKTNIRRNNHSNLRKINRKIPRTNQLLKQNILRRPFGLYLIPRLMNSKKHLIKKINTILHFAFFFIKFWNFEL